MPNPTSSTKGNPINWISHCTWKEDLAPLLNHWSKTFDTNKLYRGRREAIKYMKSLYTQAVQYSLLQRVSYIPYRKCDRDGICKDLKPFKHLLRSNEPNKTRAALAVLRQFELYQVEPSHDISTVVQPCLGQDTRLMKKFRKFLFKKGYKFLPKLDLKEPKDHLTSKKGPTGKQALLSWQEDLRNLKSETREDIILLSEILGEKGLRKRIERLISLDFPYQEGPSTRLQVFSAPGGKTRIIAIYDYWSQRVLKSLHQAIFRNLPNMKADCTYSHISAAQWLKNIPTGTEVFSYDLTAATDRIPMWLHRSVLVSVLASRQRVVVPLIERILLREFKLSWNISKSVTYNCGQPMGAYGSWALLAYSHHAIARYCGARSHEYRIIGDDIVIIGKSGKRYARFMEQIGVSISQSKSIKSPAYFPYVVGEVAKRLVKNGVEVTPPTPNLIYRSLNDWQIFPMLLEDLVSRDNTLEHTPLVALLNRFFSKKWKSNVVSVLTFPYGRATRAREIIRGVLEAICPWKEYDNTELAKLFVRYRIAILYKTAGKLCKVSSPYDILAWGGPPCLQSTEVEGSPISAVRRMMASKLIETIETLRNKERLLETLPASEVSLEILDEELYCPDYLSLKFLERKYQRQKFFSSLVLDMHKRLESGSLQAYIEMYTPPFTTLVEKDLEPSIKQMEIVESSDDELSSDDDFEMLDFEF